jgi:hypothetical protein
VPLARKAPSTTRGRSIWLAWRRPLIIKFPVSLCDSCCAYILHSRAQRPNR